MKSEGRSIDSMEPKPFEISDDDRYSRLQLIAWWDQSKLRQSRILVVGAGALGNEVLKNLALIGVGHIDIVDFDRIEHSNLSRTALFRAGDAGQPKAIIAARALRELNPDVSVTPIVGNVLNEIGLGLVQAANLVIGCLDNREARLWLNRMCWKVNRPWIDGGIQEINGVAKVFRPPHGPCYECGMTDADYRLIQLRYSCPLLQQSDLQQGRVPTAPTIASIIGGIQVQEALKLLHDFPPSDATAIVYNGVANRLYSTQYPVRPDCISHETYQDITATDFTHHVVVDQLLAWSQSHGAGPDPQLVLDRDWVAALRCESCDRTVAVERVLNQVNQREAECPACRQVMQPQIFHRVSPGGTWGQRRLKDLGVADFDIVKIESSAGTNYYGLKAATQCDRPQSERRSKAD